MLLIIKTRASNFEAVRETIHRVNTYELPEVLGYRVDWASPGFADWIEKMTTRPAQAAQPATKRAGEEARRPRAETEDPTREGVRARHERDGRVPLPLSRADLRSPAGRG